MLFASHTDQGNCVNGDDILVIDNLTPKTGAQGENSSTNIIIEHNEDDFDVVYVPPDGGNF